jgi:hypothetical protein
VLFTAAGTTGHFLQRVGACRKTDGRLYRFDARYARFKS